MQEAKTHAGGQTSMREAGCLCESADPYVGGRTHMREDGHPEMNSRKHTFQDGSPSAIHWPICLSTSSDQ